MDFSGVTFSTGTDVSVASVWEALRRWVTAESSVPLQQLPSKEHLD